VNKLLIHANNTSFNQIEIFPISEQFVFDVDLDKDVDYYIDEILTDGELTQKLKDIDIVFIKASLSPNYLEYLGIRLGYHIRLSKSLGIRANIPIVFIAEETFQFLGLTCQEPSILFTSGIYLIKEAIDDYHKVLRWYNEGYLKPLEDFSSFISSIRIDPPANYDSHHSIANEWALARYFSMLEIDGQDAKYKRLKDKISRLDYIKTLHFKFTEATGSRQRFNPKKHSYTPTIRGIENKRIAVIDDEINKGWLAFYDYLINKSNGTTIAFDDFKKDEKRDSLVQRLQSWLNNQVETDNPVDVFIVDLRLHDDDFSEVNFDNLSGISIIKQIKKANPGIQIVVSTASNKVWNYQECFKYGVTHFVIKETPETFSSREETKTALLHLSKEISSASSKSFLAQLYRKTHALKSQHVFLKHLNDKQFSELTFGKNGLLDQITGLMLLDSSNDSVINQCILLCFQVLENYCDLQTIASFGNDNSSGSRLSSGFIWLRSKQKLDVFINQPNQKISTRFELKYGRFDFQNSSSPETPVSFDEYSEMKLISAYQSGLDTSSLVKIISILFFRDNVDKSQIERIIKLRYYRSNVAAHLTGRVNSTLIDSNDIMFFIELFENIFQNR
jgi:CheY-like chemotaxis protein